MQKKFKVGAPLQRRIKLNKQRKKGESPSPNTLEKMHEKWFFNLEPDYFVQLQKEWNEVNLKIALEKHDNYDGWLNYFKTLSPNVIRMLAKTGLDILPTEAYTALSRWHDIINHPHRIDKIHQSGLTNLAGQDQKKTVAQLATENDRLGVLRATRDKIAEKLDKGAGTRDTALLTREMTEIMTQISDYEKRMGPKKTTKLGQLLESMPDAAPKRKRKVGARNVSFKSRVTIKDLEE